MKGITPVVSVILLLLVTIAIVGFATGFFQRILGTAGAGAEQQLNVTATQLGQTIRIESAEGTTVVIRSTGSKNIDLTSVMIYADDAPQTCTWSPAVVAPSGTATCTLGVACTGKTVDASAPGGDAPEAVVC